MNRPCFAILLLVALLAACSINPAYDASKPHHTKTGFRNIDGETDKRLWDFLQWRWQRLFKEIPGADSYAFPIDTTHHQLVHDNRQRTSLTWIGHATFLLQIDGRNILTDPHFSDRASPVSWAGPQRVVPPAMPLHQLPEIDLVVISHDHYDALDRTSIVALAKHNRQRPLTFIVPLGMQDWFAELELESVRVVELDWGESHTLDSVRLTAEPSRHWSKRGLFDGFKRLWASWVIEAGGRRIFFAGDTGYARQFAEIGRKYGRFDLALLPIGAYEPRWFMKSHHVNPEEAVKIHLDINSAYSVAMHWGTFILTDEPLDEPPEKLAEALKTYRVDSAEFEVYRHGETRFLDWRLTGTGG